MDNQLLTIEHIQSILDIARYAPSVHNTQPWLVRFENNCLLVSVDPNHALVNGDPTGRQTTISLGIFTEAIDIGAREIGLKISDALLTNKKVSISFENISQTESSHEAAILLRTRCSDRSIYKPIPISTELISSLEQTSSPGLSVHVISDPEVIQNVAGLTCKGIQLALSSPSFRKELSRYLVLPWSNKSRGISVKSLYIGTVLAMLQPLMLRLGLGTKAEANLEKKRWESASAVIAICSEGDLMQHWFEAGRAYLRASLVLQKAKLSQATSAAIVEASNYHEDVEKMLNTNKRILAMLRVGAGSQQKYYSPRISVKDILT